VFIKRNTQSVPKKIDLLGHEQQLQESQSDRKSFTLFGTQQGRTTHYSSARKTYQPILPAGTQSNYAYIAGEFALSRLKQTSVVEVIQKNYSDPYKLKTGLEVSVANVLKRNFRSVGLLQDQDGYQGTALLISLNLAIVARHCLEGSRMHDCSIRFGYYEGSQEEVYRIINILENDEKLDYAIIALEGTPGRKFGFTPTFNLSRYALEFRKVVQQNSNSLLARLGKDIDPQQPFSASSYCDYLRSVSRSFIEIEMKEKRKEYLEQQRKSKAGGNAIQRTQLRLMKHDVKNYEVKSVRELMTHFPQLGPNILDTKNISATDSNKLIFMNPNTGWYICHDKFGKYNTVCISDSSNKPKPGDAHVALNGTISTKDLDQRFHFRNRNTNNGGDHYSGPAPA